MNLTILTLGVSVDVFGLFRSFGICRCARRSEVPNVSRDRNAFLHLRIQTVQEEDLCSWTSWHLNLQAVQTFRKPGIGNPATRPHIPEDLNGRNPKSHYCVHKNKLLKTIWHLRVSLRYIDVSVSRIRHSIFICHIWSVYSRAEYLILLLPFTAWPFRRHESLYQGSTIFPPKKSASYFQAVGARRVI